MTLALVIEHEELHSCFTVAAESDCRRFVEEAEREWGVWHDQAREKQMARIYSFVEKAHQVFLRRRFGAQGSTPMLKGCENPCKRFVALASFRDLLGRPVALKPYDPLTSPATLGLKYPYLRQLLLKRFLVRGLTEDGDRAATRDCLMSVLLHPFVRQLLWLPHPESLQQPAHESPEDSKSNLASAGAIDVPAPSRHGSTFS